LADDVDEVEPLIEDAVDALAVDDEVGPAPSVAADGADRVIAPDAGALVAVCAEWLGDLGEAGAGASRGRAGMAASPGAAGTAASPGTAAPAGAAARPDTAGSGDTA